jgi:DNA-binding protein YbaB
VAGFNADDLRQLSGHISRLGAAAERARGDLGEREMIGISPDGLVRATVRSSKVTALSIEPAAMDLDAAALAHQILAALQDSEARTRDLLTRHLGPVTEEVEGLLREYGG